jgi:hypothetical protein
LDWFGIIGIKPKTYPMNDIAIGTPLYLYCSSFFSAKSILFFFTTNLIWFSGQFWHHTVKINSLKNNIYSSRGYNIAIHNILNYLHFAENSQSLVLGSQKYQM